MKLLIITVVEAFTKDVKKLLREADIQNFSANEIEGFKMVVPKMTNENWFSSSRNATQSHMFFSFTKTEKIDKLFPLIEEFNKKLKTHNPIRAIVVPIEKYI